MPESDNESGFWALSPFFKTNSQILCAALRHFPSMDEAEQMWPTFNDKIFAHKCRAVYNNAI